MPRLCDDLEYISGLADQWERAKNLLPSLGTCCGKSTPSEAGAMSTGSAFCWMFGKYSSGSEILVRCGQQK